MKRVWRVRLGLIMMVFGFAAAQGAATISDVLVRQLWPWQRDVVVEFVAHDVPSGVYEQAELNLFDGAADLVRVPGGAFTSDRVLCCDGKQHITFDPAKVPALAGRSKIANLRVVVAAEPLANQDDVLYQIFDLTKRAGEPGALTCVTAEALTNGLWGAWTPHYWPNVATVKTPVWLDVTNDVKWCTTHLVMRRIPAGTFQMGRASTEDVTNYANEITPPVEVTISKSYYIGVFPMTVKQYRLMENLPWQGPEDVTPDEGTTCERMRGKWTAKNALYDWPNEKSVDPNSIIGHLRTRTGRAFDLPTEAQWEKAARAGSNGVYYDGTLRTTAAARTELAWCGNNALVTESWYDPGVGLVKTNGITEAGVAIVYVRHRVGTRKPNNYGLYDTLGGVYEMVLDWQGGNISATMARTDPEGATEATDWNGSVPKRVCKGGNYIQDFYSIRLARRCQDPVNSNGSNAYGYRLCCPAE